jgi:hypothetical protein
MTMFVYIGDNYTGGDWGDHSTFPERRRKALASYLTGLNEVLKIDLPKTKPPYQPFPPQDRENKTPEGRKRYATAVAAWEKSQEQLKLIVQREVLTRQVSTPYLVEPYATEELRAEVTRSVKDPAIVQEIMAQVEARVPLTAPTAPVEELVKEAAPRRWRFWFLQFGNAAVVILVALAIFLVRRRHRPTA